MSNRKYHTKKRSNSNYKQRLVDRGLNRAPKMPTAESLRNRQPRRDTYVSKTSDYPGLDFQQSSVRTPWSKVRD